jgi:hypothetical protein
MNAECLQSATFSLRATDSFVNIRIDIAKVAIVKVRIGIAFATVLRLGGLSS